MVEESPTIFVSAKYFRVIGVALARGARFDEKTDDAPTAKPVVILGYRFWQNRLASDPDIVGKALTLDGIPHVVVGIAPDQFEGHLALQGRGARRQTRAFIERSFQRGPVRT